MTSSVLRLTPKDPPDEVDDPDHFFRVVKAAFSQRRKTLLNGLSGTFRSNFSKEQLLSAILSCGLPADIRGERLSIPQFAALSKALRQRDIRP